MSSRTQIEEAADRYGWATGETLTGAATYRRISGRLVDLSGPQMVVWYGSRGQVVEAQFSAAKGKPLLPVRGGKSAITSLLIEHGL